MAVNCTRLTGVRAARMVVFVQLSRTTLWPSSGVLRLPRLVPLGLEDPLIILECQKALFQRQIHSLEIEMTPPR